MGSSRTSSRQVYQSRSAEASISLSVWTWGASRRLGWVSLAKPTVSDLLTLASNQLVGKGLTCMHRMAGRAGRPNPESGGELRSSFTEARMIHPHITHLYLYCPPNDNTLEIFQDQQLWASKPEHFNDPFDCDIEVTKGVTEKDVMDFIHARYGPCDRWPNDIKTYVSSSFDSDGNFTSDELTRIDKVIQDLIEENENSGVVCLSEVSDSILMWSHYGRKHTGICIELERKADNKLGDSEFCDRVQYSSTYPIIDLAQMLFNPNGQTLSLMMRHKADCWSSEKEWRLFTDEGDKRSPLPGAISKVIFGLLTPAGYRERVQTLCDDQSIRTVQAMKASMEFRIVVPD